MKYLSAHNSPYLSDRHPNLAYLDKNKRSTSKTMNLLTGTELNRTALLLFRCGARIVIDEWIDQNGTNHYRKSAHWRCKNRACASCNSWNTYKKRTAVKMNLPSHFSRYPTDRYLYLTLTVRNCPPNQLSSTLDNMQSAWNKLSRRKAWPGQGYVKTLEVTRNPRTGEAHPHFHIILQVPAGYTRNKYLSEKRLSQMWGECLGVEYEPSVDIQAVKPKDGQTGQEAIMESLAEKINYCTKAVDLVDDAAWLLEVLPQLKGKRTVATGGKMKQLIKNSELEAIQHSVDPEVAVVKTHYDYRYKDERYKALQNV